jgi:chorismate mutase
MPFQNLMAGRIITFQLMLKDRTGVLAGILSIFSYYGANILTINQNIPSNGCAMLTISAETSELLCPVEELLKKTGNLDGVIKSEIVAG